MLENDAGLVLIEQRALHERLIYDTFVESMQKKEVKIQTFKVSLLLEMSPQESVLLEQSLVPLALSGFVSQSIWREYFCSRFNSGML